MKSIWIISITSLPLIFCHPLYYPHEGEAWKHEPILKELDLSWEAPSANDARSPCPFLNTAANHDLIPRSGRDIDTDRLFEALTFAGLDQSIAKTLVNGVIPIAYLNDQGIQVIDLDTLQQHDSEVGNNTVFNQDLYNEIKNFVTVQNGKDYLSFRDLGYFRKFRYDECQKLHPSTFEFPIKSQVAAAGEASLIYLLFKDATNKIRVEWMDMFFEKERLPFELGWEIPIITRGNILKATSQMMLYQNLW